MIPEGKLKKLQAELLKKLKEQLKPPDGIHEQTKLFADCCKQSGVDIKGQTIGGKAFNEFISRLKSEYQKKCRLARKLVLLYKFEQPMPMSHESAYDCFFVEGWDDCIIEAIRIGKVPAKNNGKSRDNTAIAMRAGWNKAIDEMEKLLVKPPRKREERKLSV